MDATLDLNMTDVFSKAKRSEIMRRIRSTNTLPEVRVRKELHSRGFRYRLHDSKLPGKPDIVMPKHKTVVQIRGCFWHFHECLAGRMPKSNKDYWETKLIRNRQRDERNDAELRGMGWRVFVIWECEVQSNISLVETVGILRCELTEAHLIVQPQAIKQGQ